MGSNESNISVGLKKYEFQTKSLRLSEFVLVNNAYKEWEFKDDPEF